jgi:hypothetical protein
VSFLRRRMSYASVALTLVGLSMVSCVWGLESAQADVTPGWECIPTAAGQAVVSGGTGSAPSCTASTTAVLAPTYVASGVGGKPTVEFSSVNVQVVSGSGATNGTVNGKGNLIIGYGEKPGTQTGSNNLIVGYGQSYSSYGSIVGGSYNSSAGPFTDVFGEADKASAYAASVTGGIHNVAEGVNSLVAGGQKNKAKGLYSSVGGGSENTAEGESSEVSGGTINKASNADASVSGGYENKATGPYSSISGGEINEASGELATATGGLSNRATGFNSSTIGGQANEAEGEDASVVAGFNNKAKGGQSSTVAGEFNVAEDPFSMIGGGCDNVAGSGAKNTNECGSGGEAIDGGASVAYKIKDGTGGLISDVSETSESMNVTDPAGSCGNLSIGVSGGQIGDTSLFTFPTTGSVPPAALRLTPLGVSTSGFSTFQVCNSSASSITISDPVKVLTFR